MYFILSSFHNFLIYGVNFLCKWTIHVYFIAFFLNVNRKKKKKSFHFNYFESKIKTNLFPINLICIKFRVIFTFICPTIPFFKVLKYWKKICITHVFFLSNHFSMIIFTFHFFLNLTLFYFVEIAVNPYFHSIDGDQKILL